MDIFVLEKQLIICPYMKEKLVLTQQEVKNRIYSIRGFQVMLDTDLAKMYNVETRILNQAV
jgi:hypothetical protein